MTEELTVRQLTGRDESHLVALSGGHRLQAAAADAFLSLQSMALEEGYQLAIASSFRSFERQCVIWNGKATGLREVHDDQGREIIMARLSPGEKVHAILRHSALPGISRHHWGTDIDIFDEAAMPDDYALQLKPDEVTEGGIFDPLHCWLDEKMAMDQSCGFFRPYGIDRGGVAPERWHLSYAPCAVHCESACSEGMLERILAGADIAQWEFVSTYLPELLRRYTEVPVDWCLKRYRN